MLTVDFPRVERFVCALTGAECRVAGATGIGWLREDEVVAGVLYESYTGQGGSVTAHIAIASGSSFTKEFMRAIFQYPFEQLGVRTIYAMVSSNNIESRRLVERMGFQPETKIANYYPEGDLIVYALTADNCIWLGEKHGQKDKNAERA